MAANFGKFIDRSPQICAAGKSSGELDDPHYYDDDTPLEDNFTKSTHNENNQTEGVFVLPNLVHNLTFQEREIEIELEENLPVKNDYEDLTDDASQTSADTQAHHEDGLPEDSVTALMNPPRTPYQVMWDKQVGHERYRTTHDDYNAPKPIKLSDEIVYEPEKCFRAAGKYDLNGVWVRCTCDWHKKVLEDRSSEIEADYVERYKPQIGKSLNPNHNIDSVPKGFTFGLPSHHESYGMEELSKDSDCPPCIFRRDFNKWLAALNTCRNDLRKKDDFFFREFQAKALHQDKEKTGFLPIDIFYKVCEEEHVTFHREEIESLLKVLHIIVDDEIDYERFIEIIDVNKPTIDIAPFHDLPEHNQHYATSNQEALDYLITRKRNLPAAGMPSVRGNFKAFNESSTRSSGQESAGSPLNFENK